MVMMVELLVLPIGAAVEAALVAEHNLQITL
jgi:hypothetical protein